MESRTQGRTTPLEDREYPYLGVWRLKGNARENFMVLFTEPNTGVVVESNTNDRIVGAVSNYFLENEFIYYLGELILSNDPL